MFISFAALFAAKSIIFFLSLYFILGTISSFLVYVTKIKRKQIFPIFDGYLLTLYFWLWLAIGYITAFITVLISKPFLTEKRIAYLFTGIAGKIIYFGMCVPRFWKIKSINSSQHDSGKSQKVIVANHRSFIDGWLLSVIGESGKYIIAHEYSKIPIFSYLCKISGFIFVKDYDSKNRRNAVNRSSKSMLDGSNFIIFPEGERVTKRYLGKFKTGAVRIAETIHSKCKCKIYPIILKNTDIAMGKYGMCKTATIYTLSLSPINPKGKDVRSKTDNLRELIQEYYNNL